MPDPRQHNHHAALGVIAITLLMLAGVFYTARLPDRQKAQGRLVNHTHEVLERLHLLALHVTEAESGQRGYLLSGQPDYLAPYNAATKQIGDDLNELEHLTVDNERQRSRLPQLRQAITAKLHELEKTVDLRKHSSTKEALAIVHSGRGKQLMDVIRQHLNAMKTEEEARLQSRLITWNDAASQTRTIIIAGSSVVYIMVFVVYLALNALARQRQAIAEAERRANAIHRAETERLFRIVTLQNEIVTQTMDLQAAMQLITEHTQALTCAEGGIVEMLDGEEMVYRAASGVAAPHLGLRLKAANSLSGLCLRENAVLKCDDSEVDERVDRAACRRVGLRSMVVVPLRHNGQAVGVLKVMSSRVDAFNEENVATLQLMPACCRPR